MNDLDPNVTPDDEPNPQHELASAYLDGKATADERARLESSAVLRSMVDSFARIRSELADVPAAPATARDAAVSAALAAFDAAAAGERTTAGSATVAAAPAAPAVAPVVPLSFRRRWARPLLSAAAAVLLVGVVGVALMNRDGSDSKSSGATEPPADLEMSAAADTQSAPAADGPASTIGSITGGGQVATIIDTPEQLQALPMPDTSTPAPASFATTTVGATTVPAAETVDTAAASETTAAGSAAGGNASDDSAKVAGGAPVSGALACLTAQQVYLGDIMYQGTFAIAARDTVTGVTQAITDDCTVLASVGS